MAISSKRFKFLDNETNIATSDFLSGDNLAILNSPNNIKKEITDFFNSFLSNNSQLKGLSDLVNSNKSLLDNLPIRFSKDNFPDLKDLSSLSNLDIENLASSLINNTSAFSSFNKIPGVCINGAVGKSPFGKPFDPVIGCNGKSKKTNNNCNAPSFGTSLNDLTGGLYNSTFDNLNNILGALIGLSSLGFDMNMCSVFTSLSSKVDDNRIKSRASSALLNELSSKGNVNGIMDLANGSLNLHTKVEAPNGVRKSISNFITPSDISEKEYPELSDRFMGAMEIYDSKWNVSDHDGIISAKNISLNKDIDKVLTSKLKNNIFDRTQLNIAPSNDFDFLKIAS